MEQLDDERAISSATSEDLFTLPNCPGSTTEKEEDKNNSLVIVDYSGATDPFNPRDFSTVHKWTITFIIINGAFCVAAASSIYTR